MSSEMMSPSSQRPRRRRNPVHHLVVDRRAQARRVAPVALERRLGARRPRGRSASASRSAVVTPGADRAAAARRGCRPPARWRPASSRSPPATCTRSRRPFHSRSAARTAPPARAPPRSPSTPRPAADRRRSDERRPRRGSTSTSGCGLPLVHPQPLAHHVLAVVAARHERARRSAAHAAARRYRRRVQRRRSPQIRRALSRRTRTSVGHLDVQHRQRTRGRHHPVEGPRLRHGAREAVEHEPRRRVAALRSRSPRRSRPSGRRSRAGPASITRFDGPAQSPCRVDGLAQDVARRDPRHSQPRRQALGLRALSRPGRTRASRR